jgi:hypothetical protein
LLTTLSFKKCTVTVVLSSLQTASPLESPRKLAPSALTGSPKISHFLLRHAVADLVEISPDSDASRGQAQQQDRDAERAMDAHTGLLLSRLVEARRTIGYAGRGCASIAAPKSTVRPDSDDLVPHRASGSAARQ